MLTSDDDAVVHEPLDGGAHERLVALVGRRAEVGAAARQVEVRQQPVEAQASAGRRREVKGAGGARDIRAEVGCGRVLKNKKLN